MESYITIKGAREHNLKNIDLCLPRNKFIVITGLSGSGKSSLAFDTIYAEGQRRYLESLSSYARQFLEKLKKPELDYISGLSPSISIEQRHFTHNPRSTVATITEIYDYLRLLYAKLGQVYCYQCARPITKQSRGEILQKIFQLAKEKEISLFAPLVKGRKGEYRKLFEEMRKKGFSKIRIDGQIYDLTQEIKIHKGRRHDIELLVDHLYLQTKVRNRLESSLELALSLAAGTCLVSYGKEKPGRGRLKTEILFSERMTCPECGLSFGEFSPNMFSFNSPYGACPRCRGLGRVSQVMSHLVIKDEKKPLLRGALNEEIFFAFNKYFIEELIFELQERYQLDINTPYGELPQEIKEAFFWGGAEFSGLLEELRNLFHRTSSETIKNKIKRFLREEECGECQGGRIRKESQGVKIGGKNIVEVSQLSIARAIKFFDRLKFSSHLVSVSEPILKEIKARLKFLYDVGLGYLTLDRTVTTLGGGELQRIRLARQISVGLTGVLYILDEPSIGLHPRDNAKLLASLKNLRDLKNTIIVVEHDEETIRNADYVVDLGPGAGEAGGAVVASGELARLYQAKESLTAQYLNRNLKIELPPERKDYSRAKSLWIRGASEHNLKNVDVRIPLGFLVCITGVSGSGKSTLVHDILFQALHNKIWKLDLPVGKFKALEGAEEIDKVLEIDQSPIGRTPRSNPATYTDIFVHIRRLFAQTPEARMRSFNQSRFSFNLKGGRCETCQGEGYQQLKMSFLPDLYVLCEACLGKRYNEKTLEVTYRGKTIAEVLDFSASGALEFFQNIPVLRERLKVLVQIGLGYLKLGQPSTTLSGGEAQRVKLAFELGKRSTGKTLYILDEPTTGLHFADIDNLLKALFALREAGNTMVVIEHNLEVIKMADYIIDLGPEGGEQGGRVLATGSPEEIIKNPRSYTAYYLKNYIF